MFVDTFNQLNISWSNQHCVLCILSRDNLIFYQRELLVDTCPQLLPEAYTSLAMEEFVSLVFHWRLCKLKFILLLLIDSRESNLWPDLREHGAIYLPVAHSGRHNRSTGEDAHCQGTIYIACISTPLNHHIYCMYFYSTKSPHDLCMSWNTHEINPDQGQVLLGLGLNPRPARWENHSLTSWPKRHPTHRVSYWRLSHQAGHGTT